MHLTLNGVGVLSGKTVTGYDAQEIKVYDIGRIYY